MTDKYCATMENNVHIGRQDYWKVNIEANSLNELNNICSALNLIRNGGLNDSTIVETMGRKKNNTITYTHTLNWYCLNIGCPKCPYRVAYMCFYGNKEYKQKVMMND